MIEVESGTRSGADVDWVRFLLLDTTKTTIRMATASATAKPHSPMIKINNSITPILDMASLRSACYKCAYP